MNINGTLRTILCGGVSGKVLSRGTTELFGKGGGKLVVRRPARRRKDGRMPIVTPPEDAPN